MRITERFNLWKKRRLVLNQLADYYLRPPEPETLVEQPTNVVSTEPDPALAKSVAELDAELHAEEVLNTPASDRARLAAIRRRL